ncbi:hypothetical protein Tco_0475285 [Tanacetum coccineum]
MDTTRAEQIALDDALVSPANWLKIGKSNLRLSSDLKSKEATLQVVYDVLKLTPFYKAFQITTDVLEIYRQEHEDTQLYGVILPIDLTNEAIKDSETYKEYHAITSGAEPSKTKVSVKKNSHTSGSGADEGTGVTPGVPDVPKYGFDDEQISWKSSSDEDDDAESENDNDNDDTDNQDDDGQEYDEHDDEEQGDDDEKTDSDNNGDDFVHPNVEEIQDANVEGNKMNEEETSEEAEVDALYRDVNVNLEGKYTEMTDALRTIVQTTQVIEDTHVIITPVNPEVDVPVTTITEPTLLSTTTLSPPPTPLNTHLQQTPVPTPPTVPSSSLQDLSNFGSLFRFDHRLKTLENNFSDFNQTNQFAATSDRLRDEAQAENADFINKLDDNTKKIIKDQVKEQVKAQVSKILPKIEKTVNEQLEAEVLTHLSNESKTSHAIAANLSELELKKILIDKIESNKSIHRSDEQKNLYKALVDAYESDKLILDTYGETILFKRRRDEKDKDEEPSVGSNRGSKRRRAGNEPESTSAP